MQYTLPVSRCEDLKASVRPVKASVRPAGFGATAEASVRPACPCVPPAAAWLHTAQLRLLTFPSSHVPYVPRLAGCPQPIPGGSLAARVFTPFVQTPQPPVGSGNSSLTTTASWPKRRTRRLRSCSWTMASCVCKKSACQRWAGFKDEPKQPGRPAKFTKLSIPMARALTSSETLPRPPILQRIDEIWGMRFRRV